MTLKFFNANSVFGGLILWHLLRCRMLCGNVQFGSTVSSVCWTHCQPASHQLESLGFWSDDLCKVGVHCFLMMNNIFILPHCLATSQWLVCLTYIVIVFFSDEEKTEEHISDDETLCLQNVCWYWAGWKSGGNPVIGLASASHVQRSNSAES